MKDTRLFAEKVVLITGASRGIGEAAAVEFSRAGAEVLAVSRSRKSLDALVGRAAEAGGKIVPLVLDVINFAGIERLATLLQERYGRLDIFVGNGRRSRFQSVRRST